MYTQERLEELRRDRRAREKRRARRRMMRTLAFVLGTLGLTLTLHFVCQAEALVTGEPQPTFSRPDTTAPEILGVKERTTVYLGQSVAYLDGVTVQDDQDENPTLEVDSSGVNLTTPGTYGALYTASDASGNVRRVYSLVTVAQWPLEDITDEMIDEAADALLKEIVDGGLTMKEQVYQVYRWAWDNIRYQGHSDREDWRRTAYITIVTKTGDCYGYFAAGKLLLEKLGLKTIDVQKTKHSPEDSEHFWSLVSLDGGSTYYHFDCTPRWGQKQAFCLVTDAFLDAYSQAHKGSHDRDKTLYPATPEV